MKHKKHKPRADNDNAASSVPIAPSERCRVEGCKKTALVKFDCRANLCHEHLLLAQRDPYFRSTI